MRRKNQNCLKPVSRAAGFTLIELLVTLIVASIALAIAIPSFSHMIADNRLTATANQYIDAISSARLEAIKRNLSTQFCSNAASDNSDGNGTDPLGTACGVSAGAVYAENSDGTATEIQSPITLSSDLVLGDGSNSGTAMQALRYTGTGLASTPGGSMPYSGLVADIYSTRISSDNHRCIYLATGSLVSSCIITDKSGGCPANEPKDCQK